MPGLGKPCPACRETNYDLYDFVTCFDRKCVVDGCGRSCCSRCAPSSGSGLIFCRDCQGTHYEFEAVLERFPHNAAIWANVALELRASHGHVNVALDILNETLGDSTSKDGARDGILYDGSSAHASMSAAGTFVVEGRRFVRLNAKNCLERALELQPSKRLWKDLAVTMAWGEHAFLRLRHGNSTSGGGLTVYALDTEAVFRTALHFFPNSSTLWYSLAQKLPPAEVFHLNDEDSEGYNLSRCLHRALDCDASNVYAWVLLGVTLKEQAVSERKSIQERFEKTKKDRLSSASVTSSKREPEGSLQQAGRSGVRNTTTSSSDFSQMQGEYDIATCTDEQRSLLFRFLQRRVVATALEANLSAVSQYTWQECFERAIDICKSTYHLPQIAGVWSNLASVMEAGDIVCGVTRVEAALEAVRCDRANPTTVFNLACLLSAQARDTCSEPLSARRLIDVFGADHEEYVRDQMRHSSDPTVNPHATASGTIMSHTTSGTTNASESNLSTSTTTTSTAATANVRASARREAAFDIFLYMLDTKMDLRSVKMRLILGLMYPSHPHILNYGKRFVVTSEVIGAGFESTVFGGVERVREQDLRRLAVKRIPFEFAAMERKQQRVLAEVRELSVLLHEKFSAVIVPCVHVAFTQENRVNDGGVGYAYIFMDRAESSLEKFTGRCTADQLLLIAYQIIKAVSVLHFYSFVHGDIKGANLLAFADGSVRLADFGFSQCVTGSAKDAETNADFSQGLYTSGYQAPEVLGGLVQKPTPEADIYAIGCTLFKLAVGYEPPSLIDDINDTEWDFCRYNGIDPCGDGVPPIDPRIVALVRACTATRPENRKTASELLQLPELAELERVDRRSGSFRERTMSASQSLNPGRR